MSADSDFDIGEVVEVTGGEKIFLATVTAKLSETEYKLKYFEYEAEVTLPPPSLQKIPAAELDESEVFVEITAKTDNGYIVTFVDYGNSEEVPLSYLRPAKDEPKKDTKNSDGPEGIIQIPESLKILPTDTEEEKNRKKKRIKAINFKNKKIVEEAEAGAVQNTWKSFVEKGTKRSLTGMAKSSQFTSSEDVNSKVGVTNSGKGITVFGDRKKYKFSNRDRDGSGV